MKQLLAVLAMLVCLSGRAAFFPNSFTTNSTGKTGNTIPSNTSDLYPLMFLLPDGTGPDRTIYFNANFLMRATNAVFGGSMSLNGRTNKLSIANDQLLLDGVAISGGTAAAPINNLYVTNLFVQNGSHNTMIISNSLTIQPVKTNLLATTSTGLVTNANYGSGISWDPTTRTLSATASGSASTWVPNAALAYSGGTNVTMDASGGTNFTLLVTNTVFMAAPSNPPGSTSTNTSWTVTFKMDGTGGYAVTWTNLFKGAQFQPLTNANAISLVTITTSPFTNGQYWLDYGIFGLQ